MLEIKNVYKTYTSNNGVSCRALENVSLKFPSKGLVFILGKSGSGKSTLLNLIGGLDNFDRGEITYNGAKFTSFSKEDFEYYRNALVGFVFQDFCLFDNLSAIDNVRFALSLQRKSDNEACLDALKQVGASNIASRNINELTGGQKQRIAIARAIVKKAKIILADEPTGSLDSDSSKDIMDLLAKQAKTSLVIVVTHNKELANEYAERIIEIQDGFILKDMAVSQSKDSKTKEMNMMYSSSLLYIPESNKLTSNDVDELNNVMQQEKRQDFYFLVEQNKERIVSIYPNMKEVFFPTNKEDKYVPYRYVNDTNDDETFKKENNSMSLGTSLKFGKSLNKKRKGKLFLSIFISIIMVIVIGIISNYANYNLKEAMSISLANNDSKYIEVASSFSVSDADYKLQEKDFAFLDNLGYEYVKKYNVTTAMNSTTECNISKASKDTLFTGSFSGFIETDNLEELGYKYLYKAENLTEEEINKGVNISSVVAGTLEYYGIGSMEQLIRKEVKINNNKYKIIGIFDTNYDKYKQLRYISGDDYTTIYDEYEEIKDNVILRLVVSSGFINNYIDNFTKYDNTIKINTTNILNKDVSFNRCSDITKNVPTTSEDHMVIFKEGLHGYNLASIEDNEIFVGREAFKTLIGINYDTNNLAEMKNLVSQFNDSNRTITFKTKDSATLKETYITIDNAKIVGAFENNSSTYRLSIFLNHNQFTNLTKVYFRASSVMLKLSDDMDYTMLVNNLYNNGFVINDDVVYYLVQLINSFKQYNVILEIGLVVWIFIVALLFYSFMSKSIQDSKRQIGILKALGANRKDIYKIFTYEALLLAIISIIGGAGIYVGMSYLVDYLVTASLKAQGINFYYPVFIANYKTILTMIIPSLLVLVFSLIIPISKANKIKPIEVMNRE